MEQLLFVGSSCFQRLGRSSLGLSRSLLESVPRELPSIRQPAIPLPPPPARVEYKIQDEEDAPSYEVPFEPSPVEYPATESEELLTTEKIFSLKGMQ